MRQRQRSSGGRGRAGVKMVETIHERIGEAVQNIRVRVGISVDMLALNLGISVDPLEAVEAGQRRLKAGELHLRRPPSTCLRVMFTRASKATWGDVYQLASRAELWRSMVVGMTRMRRLFARRLPSRKRHGITRPGLCRIDRPRTGGRGSRRLAVHTST